MRPDIAGRARVSAQQQQPHFPGRRPGASSRRTHAGRLKPLSPAGSSPAGSRGPGSVRYERPELDLDFLGDVEREMQAFSRKAARRATEPPPAGAKAVSSIVPAPRQLHAAPPGRGFTYAEVL